VDQRRSKRIAEAMASEDMAALVEAMVGDSRQSRPRCNLCGAQLLEPNQAVLEKLAAQGMSRVSIRQLNALRFKRKR
jgi:hypothetical protein